MRKLLKSFSPFELVVTFLGVLLVVVSYCVFGKDGYLKLIASIIGLFMVLFTAKGNPLGQMLAILFSLIYAVISVISKYYGEMITYIFMALPMAIFSTVSWLKNPYKNNKSVVKVGTLKGWEYPFLGVLTAIVTVVVYFLLKWLNNANLVPSTFSIATSFMAGYLIFRRSPLYAIAYSLNDIVLVILWFMMSFVDKSCYALVVCFLVFFVFDIYGFVNWLKMAKKQKNKC